MSGSAEHWRKAQTGSHFCNSVFADGSRRAAALTWRQAWVNGAFMEASIVCTQRTEEAGERCLDRQRLGAQASGEQFGAQD
jgi:hypothetical protein